ncbi:MAG: hypothetical protein JXQ71_00475 [Verrucomicrobia bacterium]|nr:hypothetical protein [Verrucomicrobiota bacterium]
MKLTTVNGTLLLLNLGLIGVVAYLVSHRPGPAASAAAGRGIELPLAAARTTQVVVRGVAPRILTVTNEFQWGQLESEDYREYVARLRSIGCPEQTLRDIIIADLDKLLAPRMSAIYGRRADLQYWHSEEEELANDRDHAEWGRRERELDREKREIIMELLGVDVVRERMKLKGYQDYYERRLGFLPEGKRTGVRQVLERFDGREKALAARRQEGGGWSEKDRLEWQDLRAEKQQALAELLSPGEQQLYELWMSPSANAVRYAFYGMDATEEEFRTVYDLRKTFDEQWDPDQLRWEDTTQLEQWSEAKRTLDRQIREALGEARYREYRRGEDPDWHRLNAVVTRHGLPRGLSAQAYDLQQMYRDTRAMVENDPGLDAAQRDAALREIAAQSQRAIGDILGDAAYGDFRNGGSAGSWVR